MATIAEMFVDIGADASQFEREANNMQGQMRGIQSEMRAMAATMGTSATQMANNSRYMSDEMRQAYRAQAEAMRPFRQAQQEVEYGFFQMAQGMDSYTGSTGEFMSELTEMGNRQRQVTNQMMDANNMARTSFIRTVATMLARSTQSSKIAENLRRMGGPFAGINSGLLRITGNLERMAARGQPAVLALEMLGPTASMRQLNDMTRLITAGLMRFQMVAMAAVVANALMFSSLHDAAKDTVPGYKAAFQEMGASMKEAFQPMVDVFAAVMIPVYNFINAIAQMAIRFNEAHPVLAKIIQGFLMLIPLLTLILSPLAIGIGLFMGMRAAFASVWMLIGPLVTGLGAMMGTVLLVAATIAVLVGALYLLWTRNEAFRDGVISAWEAIKTAAMAIWNWIYANAIKPAIDAIVTFVQSKLTQLKTFWDQNGTMIMQAAQNVWGVIQSVITVVMTAIGAIMQVLWPVIKVLIISTWEAIKLAISGAINIILGIIKFFAALFTGDWSAMWEATKQILHGIVQLILGIVQLQFIGGILKGVKAFAITFKTLFTGIWNGLKGIFTTGVSAVKGVVTKGFDEVVGFIQGLGSTFFNAGKGLIEMMAKGIESAASSVINTVKNLAGKVRDFLPFSPAKTGPLSDLDHLDFGGPISDSINGAIPQVQGLMSSLLAMPAFGVDGNITTGSGDTYGDIYVQVDPKDFDDMQSMFDFFNKFKQVKRARG